MHQTLISYLFWSLMTPIWHVSDTLYFRKCVQYFIFYYIWSVLCIYLQNVVHCIAFSLTLYSIFDAICRAKWLAKLSVNIFSFVFIQRNSSLQIHFFFFVKVESNSLFGANNFYLVSNVEIRREFNFSFERKKWTTKTSKRIFHVSLCLLIALCAYLIHAACWIIFWLHI